MAESSNSNEFDGMRQHGLTVLTAAVFVAGEMAGSGILALPKAILEAGWIGFILLILFCLNAAYSGSRLGDCWSMVEERYPEYRTSTRNPYPTIASVSLGAWGGYLVSVCVQLTLFGVGTVYLLLASSIIQQLLGARTWIATNNDGCSPMFPIFAAVICIPMWLGTPKDFWLVGFGALSATVLSCICIFIQIVDDGLSKGLSPPSHELTSFKEFFLAFGVILFVYGGASTFPTIQNDMVDRNKFYKSVRIAFTVILILYLPIALSAYFIYGVKLTDNVIEVLSPSVFTELAKVFMAAHLILAFLIIINPVSQDLEEIFNVPAKFCMKRCILRTFIICLMVIIGETIPKFSHILALVGGSTVTMATFILPPYLYMRISYLNEKHVPLYEKIYMWELILVGIVGGIASSYSAIQVIITDPLSKPCYWPNP
ncbi:hypothetical protein V9T40_004524 [Parthenolecanium corni]|uniref:Amino acid transporter transmembrane domain-containing protein n=1 Tax=Parthenolecanium corni TaxID=536013 RepID=A0AAN9Y9N9_9HEMI